MIFLPIPDPDPQPLFPAVLRIRIRIRIHQIQMFFGLPDPDPDPLVRGMVWIRILLSSCNNNKKNLESYYSVTLFDFLSLKNNVSVPSKSNKQKKLCKKISFLLASWRSMTKISGYGSGSLIQRHGFADPDQDPHQNVMDPEHWFPDKLTMMTCWRSVPSGWIL